MSETRSAIVALVGRANVGKSTLMNRILGEKVSIVSPIAQTTRNLVRGVLTEKRGQLAFLDTPGVHKASYDLGRIMNRTARSSIEGSDVALLLLDASQRPRDEDLGWMQKLCRGEATVAIALNKTDINGEFIERYREG
ncbi:MAG: GTPase Era, partial [Kiritimatiellia bacterium]|nr:GTPase Era [Kiritimatiellia bacterium]